jgi:hypothetical protein
MSRSDYIRIERIRLQKDEIKNKWRGKYAKVY